MKHLTLIWCAAVLACAGRQAPDDDSGKPEPSAQVNIKDFANRVVDGDWSPAI